MCEALFLDLVDLTKRFQDVKLKNEGNVNEMKQMEAYSENLKKENASLIERMNKLYQEKVNGSQVEGWRKILKFLVGKYLKDL